MDYGFANYTLAGPSPDTPIPPVAVVLGTMQTVTPVLSESSPVLLEKSQQKSVTTAVQVAEQVKAPVEAGQRLGTLTLQANGTVLAEIPLVAPEAVARRTWWDLTRELLQQICFCADE